MSRREIIRSSIVAGGSAVGLTAQVTAHEDEESESDGSKKDEEEEADGSDKEEEKDADGAEKDDREDGGSTKASITISDHETSGETVYVSSVRMPDSGFVSIHDRRRFEGQILPSIIGITDFLEPGTHSGVSVPLFTENATAPGPAEGQDREGLTESQPLIAIPHRDVNDSGAFDEGDPAYEDGPKTLDEFPVVNDIATVYVEGDDEDQRKEAKAEENDARAEFS